MLRRKVFKHELLNIVRSRIVLLWTVAVFVLSLTILRVAGDFGKAILALYSILSVVAPLISLLYAGIYWYYADRFTQLVLTMPIQRADFFFARWSALVLALGGSVAVGIFAAFGCFGGLSVGLLLACVLVIFLVLVFSTLGMLMAVYCPDRMKGIGMMLALWLYFVMVHDGLLLLVLALFKDYPLDIFSAFFAALNPIGLVRVLLLLHFDAPLLLSQTGAMVRRMVTSWESYAVGAALAAAWIFIPAQLAKRRFVRSDF